VEELQQAIDTANETINKIYSDAGVFCGDDNDIAKEGDKKENSGVCEIGNCNACTDSAEQKCKCIAISYFQSTHFNLYGKGNNWQVANLGKVTYSSDECRIVFEQNYNCKDCNRNSCSGADSPTGFDCANTGGPYTVTFGLSKDDNVSVSSQSYNTDYDTVVLMIGDSSMEIMCPKINNNVNIQDDGDWSWDYWGNGNICDIAWSLKNTSGIGFKETGDRIYHKNYQLYKSIDGL